MDIAALKTLIDADFTECQISSELGVSRSTVRHYRDKHKLGKPAKRGPRANRNAHFCKNCGENSPDNFYPRMKSSCKECHNKYVRERGDEIKEWAIDYKGGECQTCGYNSSKWALQFHHVDPSTKDPSFERKRGWSKKRLAAELDKCILLCANCHIECHENIFLKEALVAQPDRASAF